jgi:hypothetical protein
MPWVYLTSFLKKFWLTVGSSRKYHMKGSNIVDLHHTKMETSHIKTSIWLVHLMMTWWSIKTINCTWLREYADKHWNTPQSALRKKSGQKVMGDQSSVILSRSFNLCMIPTSSFVSNSVLRSTNMKQKKDSHTTWHVLGTSLLQNTQLPPSSQTHVSDFILLRSSDQ